MSAALAIKHKGHVWMAADSGITAEDSIEPIETDSKIIKCGPLTIGYVGPVQGINTLRYRYVPPKKKAGETDDYYIYDSIWNSMGKKLVNDGVATKTEDIVVPDVTLLFVYKGRLFETDSAFAFYERKRYATGGVGCEYASALIEQISDDEKDIEGALTDIMEKIIEKHNFVCKPIKIVRI